MSKVPEELKPWIAEEGQDPTEVTEPLFIDYRAAKDLFAYHPGFLGSKDYKLRHVAKEDKETKEYHVEVDSLSNNWDEKFRIVTKSLKLFLKKDSFGNHYLLDDKVEGPSMHGWSVTKWVVVKNVDSNGNNVHQDLITWKKEETEILSMYTWLPYNVEPDIADNRPLSLYIGSAPR